MSKKNKGLKRYDLMTPKDLKFRQEDAIALLAEFDDALDRGILHFSPKDKMLLKTPGEILSVANDMMCIVVWGPDMGGGSLGLLIISVDDEKKLTTQRPLVGMHPEILKQLPILKKGKK